MHNETTPQPAIGDATKWFRGCTNQEEIDARLEQHKNACRWEVLTLDDIRAAKNEYASLTRILRKDAERALSKAEAR